MTNATDEENKSAVISGERRYARDISHWHCLRDTSQRDRRLRQRDGMGRTLSGQSETRGTRRRDKRATAEG